MPTYINRVVIALVAALAYGAPVFVFAGEAEWKADMEAGFSAQRSGDFRTSILRFKAALGEAEQFGRYDERLGDTLVQLGMLQFGLDAKPQYIQKDAFSEAEQYFKRALAIYETTLGAEHTKVGELLFRMSPIYEIRGQNTEAEALIRRSLQISQKASKPNYLDIARRWNSLGVHLAVGKRYADAEEAYKYSVHSFEAIASSNPEGAVNPLENLDHLFSDTARYAEVEDTRRKILTIMEKVHGLDHPKTALWVDALGEVYFDQGRYADAEVLFRRALVVHERTLERQLRLEDLYIVNTLRNLARIYHEAGRYKESEQHYRRALSLVEHLEVREDLDPKLNIELQTKNQWIAYLLADLANLYTAQGIYTESEAYLKRARSILEIAYGPKAFALTYIWESLASLYMKNGSALDAEVLYKNSLELHESSFSHEHPSVGHLLGRLAKVYELQGRIDDALESARKATTLLADQFVWKRRAADPEILGNRRAVPAHFEYHVALLDKQRDRKPDLLPEVTRESFKVAQLARASDTAEQVAKMAARYATGSGDLAQLARMRQDAISRWQILDTELRQSLSKPTTDRNTDSEQKTKTQQDLLRSQIAYLDLRLEHEYPQYRELTDPGPVALEAIQQLLGEDEAIVAMLVTSDRSYLWVLRRNSAGFFRFAIKQAELIELVKKLRRQLDLDAGEPERILSQPFNVVAAHELYRKILAPAESLLAGAKHLIIVPDGALQSLPLGLLVTEPPTKPNAGLAELAQVPWLTKKYAISVLPSVSSLRALRVFARASPGAVPFRGFGNPVLEGIGGASRGVNLSALFSRGAVANVSEVRKLPPLPETADELRAIAATLNAPIDSLYLGPAATETRVKSLDLSQVRNLAFATHGAVAGDIKGMAEPGLVLTPPVQGTEQDDGLLTPSEIAQLKLNADWVILSACNTAAADGTPGAEGLSGLAKAFFYAGARSLLVSHWAVSSEAAQALTTRMFEEVAKGASKAGALQRSMLALMQRTDKPYFAHPAFWAPFVVVGEGK